MNYSLEVCKDIEQAVIRFDRVICPEQPDMNLDVGHMADERVPAFLRKILNMSVFTLRLRGDLMVVERISIDSLFEPCLSWTMLAHRAAHLFAQQLGESPSLVARVSPRELQANWHSWAETSDD